MTFTLPTTLFSPDQLRECAEGLHAYGVALQGSKKTKPTLSAEAESLLSLLPAEEQTKTSALESLRAWLEETAAAGPQLELVFSTVPPPALTQELVAWLRTNIKSDILVRCKIQPSMGGGMMVRTPRRTHDWSFRTLLLQKPERLTEILANG